VAGKWWIGGVLAVAMAAVYPHVATAQAKPAQAQTAPATQPANVEDYVRRLERSLGEGSTAARYETAQRLASINRPDARAALTRALASTDTDPRIKVAVVHAAGDAISPDPAWIPYLSNVLEHEQNVENAGYAATGLARFDDDARAVDTLIRVAKSKIPGQLPAISALGRVVQKRSAAALLALMNDPAESAAVHDAATNALSQISPQTGRNAPITVWTRWWNERNNLNDPAWRAQIVEEQHRFKELSDARADEQLAQLRNALYRALYNQYEQQPATGPAPNNKSDFLLRLLNDPSPEVRAAGARIVPNAVDANVQLKPDVIERLEYLLGDASPDVRLNVATALEKRYDPNAFNPLVLQLKVENDLQVKKSLINTLARMGAPAIPVLKGLLADPSEAVAAAAAEALASLAPPIGPGAPPANAQVRQDMFDLVRQTLVDRTGPPGQPKPDASVDLRASLVLALGATADWGMNEMVPLFRQFIDAEPAVVRKAGVQAMAAAGMGAGQWLSDKLNPINEPDPEVRQAAAKSLAALKSFQWANRLMDATRAPAEPNAAVREAAWQSLQQLLPLGEPIELSPLATDFKNHHEADRRLIVQRAICNKTTDARSKAAELETAGDIAKDDLNKPDEAIPLYNDALRYYQQANQPSFSLIRSLLGAYLASNQIDAAIEFCRKQIQLEERTRDIFGPVLADTAEKWGGSNNPANLELARQLINGSLTLGLDKTFEDRLKNDLKGLPPPPSTRPTTNPPSSDHA
jgi:HEAT repeat protein